MFFTSWELWQQMTFVLAMSIVVVFCAGLGKLWWNNRLLKKQEVLDVEKRARIEEMRKTGLPLKRANPVPFGVRAIQSGVEVDGIWISRPASLNEQSEKLASSTTLAGRDSDSHKKGRDHSGDERSVVVTTTSLDRAGPKQSPSATSTFQKLTDTDSVESAQSAALPVSKFAHKPKRHSSRPAPGTLNEDTLRRLEGHRSPSPKPHYETYVPTTSSTRPTFPRHNHHHHRHHLTNNNEQSSGVSSSASSVDSQPRSFKSASGRSFTSSSHSSRLYMASRGHPHTSATAGARTASHDNGAPRRWSEKESRSRDRERDPFETPTRTPSGFSVFSVNSVQQQQQQQHQQGQVQGVLVDMAAPEPTFGPGDLHFNRAARRVNEGFDVLPAGTFGVSGGMEVERERAAEGEREVGGRDGARSGGKLRKSGGGHQQGEMGRGR